MTLFTNTVYVCYHPSPKWDPGLCLWDRFIRLIDTVNAHFRFWSTLMVCFLFSWSHRKQYSVRYCFSSPTRKRQPTSVCGPSGGMLLSGQVDDLDLTWPSVWPFGAQPEGKDHQKQTWGCAGWSNSPSKAPARNTANVSPSLRVRDLRQSLTA